MKHIFWHVVLPLAIIAGANAFDWKTTSDSIHRGNTENASAWMIGKHPSNLKITIGGATNFSLESLIYFRGQNENKKLKLLSLGTVSYFEVQHVIYGIKNERTYSQWKKNWSAPTKLQLPTFNHSEFANAEKRFIRLNP